MRRVPFFLLSVALAAASFFIVFFCGFNDESGGVVEEKSYIELWHIDCFEGGTGSRASFLRKISAEYEKKYNVCVTVKVQTSESIAELFEKGVYPDLLSYGNGTPPPYQALRLTGKKTPYDYAFPWCSGGYVAISRAGAEEKSVIVSVQKYTLPRLAMYFSGKKFTGTCTEVASDKAVYEFYADKNAVLIGTQRDLYRLAGKGLELNVRPLDGFNDLYQYLSIVSESDERARLARDFADYLSSDGVQRRLSSIGMRSVFSESSYDSEPVAALAELKIEYVTSPLITAGELEKLKNLSLGSVENVDEIIGRLVKLGN